MGSGAFLFKRWATARTVESLLGEVGVLGISFILWVVVSYRVVRCSQKNQTRRSYADLVRMSASVLCFAGK